MSQGLEKTVGLCARCQHARVVETRRAVYWLCELSKSDPRFEKYPRLPVLECDGHEPAPTNGGERP